MKKSKFTESQIFSILNEAANGFPICEVLRKHGISSATFYKWRSKYGGMELSELKKLRELEREVAQYKALLAESALKIRAMELIIEKKF